MAEREKIIDSADCPMVEAATQAHLMLKEVVDSMGDEPEWVGSFKVSKNTAHWHATCQQCLGNIVVDHCYSDPELGQHVKAQLPYACPLKPTQEEAPVLFMEWLPSEKN
jgi:hypothetical protein